MQGVAAIAELFYFRRPDRIDQLAEFLQAAERFLQPGEIGQKHAFRIGAMFFAGVVKRSAHIGLCFSGGQKLLAGYLV